MPSQSLCFQGWLLTSEMVKGILATVSQSLCFQGWLLTYGRPVRDYRAARLNPFVFRAGY